MLGMMSWEEKFVRWVEDLVTPALVMNEEDIMNLRKALEEEEALNKDRKDQLEGLGKDQLEARRQKLKQRVEAVLKEKLEARRQELKQKLKQVEAALEDAKKRQETTDKEEKTQ